MRGAVPMGPVSSSSGLIGSDAMTASIAMGFPKITNKGTDAQKSTLKDNVKKHPQGQCEKAPTYYIHGVVSCVGREGLLELLSANDQGEWCSRCRMDGLQLLLAQMTKRNKPTGFAFSASLAQDYCSQIKRPKSKSTVGCPLPLLVKIGVLETVRAALWRGHLKQSTIYRLKGKYADQRVEVKLELSPKQEQRFADANARKEKRLNRRHPVRAGILESLNRLSLAESARPIIANLRKQGANEIVRAIDCKVHKCTFDESGTATTTISSLPRELKGHLKLSGEDALFCDISHAHHCWLPRILDDRIKYYQERQVTWAICFQHAVNFIRDNPGACLFGLFIAQRPLLLSLDNYEQEKAKLIDFLNTGDYYSNWCEDGEDKNERDKIKKMANRLLNFSTHLASRIPLYRKWKSEFPLVFRIIEDIKCSKSRGHRAISIQLRYFTAQAVTAALLELQSMGVEAVPQTDAILCQRRHGEAACKALGRAVFDESRGVSCKVDGIRYTPSSQAGVTNSTWTLADLVEMIEG